jgi:hypothetical protein
VSSSARGSLIVAAVLAVVAWTVWRMVKRRTGPDLDPPPSRT